MTLRMIGCSHHDVAVEIRERLSISDAAATQLFDQFSQRFPGAELVCLSTCNRTELYVAAASPTSSDSPPTINVEEMVELIAGVIAEPVGFVKQHLHSVTDRAAVEHLFLVAASLDSMIVGEAQILSQVKQAYDLANVAGATGPITHAVFQAANRAAKRVQTETTIHRRRLSVPSVAIGEVVPEVFDSLRGKRVVVCGAGEMAEETLRYLRAGGADSICLLNRTYEKAVKMAAGFGIDVDRWETLAQRFVEADLIIGTTSSDDPLIAPEEFARLNGLRGGRILLVLDLAVPRDFHPAIGNETGVYLYQIDDLRTLCDRNRREREKQWPKAKQIIDDEVASFFLDLNQRATGPVIRQLRERAERVKLDELQRLLGKLNGTMNDESIKEIEKSFDRLTNKLLHPPMASLKDDAATGHSRGLLEALRHLFKLGDD